jgi:hypothetical protein
MYHPGSQKVNGNRFFLNRAKPPCLRLEVALLRPRVRRVPCGAPWDSATVTERAPRRLACPSQASESTYKGPWDGGTPGPHVRGPLRPRRPGAPGHPQPPAEPTSKFRSGQVRSGQVRSGQVRFITRPKSCSRTMKSLRPSGKSVTLWS